MLGFQRVGLLDFRSHLKSRAFAKQPLFDYSKSGLVDIWIITVSYNMFQVVKQLNMAVILKGRDGPVYEKDELKNFCLVAVIGSRERCLRDDFRPLNLQNPWKSGKLFVRMKNDLLAAFERTSIEATNSSCQDTASNTTTTTTLL